MINWEVWKRNSYLKLAACFAFIAIVILAGRGVATQVDHAPALLYVLDTGEGWFEHAQILQVDTKSGRIRKAFAVGDNPDMALSPDESRLYVTSVTRDPDDEDLVESWLSVYDTPSGRLLDRVSNPDAMGHTLPVYGSEMAVSPSGRWLYITKFRYNPDRSYYWYLAAFDTVHSQFLREQFKFRCPAPVVIPAPQDLHLVAICQSDPFIYDINLEKAPAAATRVPIQPVTEEPPAAPSDSANLMVPFQPQESWGAAFLLPSEDKVRIFDNTAGYIYSFDRFAGTSSMVGQNALLKMEQPLLVMGLVAQDEDAVYVQTRMSRSSSESQSYSFSNKVLVADTKTFAIRCTLNTSKPFFSMSLSRDGNTLFLVNPDTATISVVDTSTLKELREIPGVGKRPILAIPAAFVRRMDETEQESSARSERRHALPKGSVAS